MQKTDYLHVLINNAGIARDRLGTIMDKSYFEDIRAMFETNTSGPLRVTQSVLDLLLRGEPKILVNISSLAESIGSVTRVNQYGYTMSKAALLNIPLGEGYCDYDRIFTLMRERGYAGWITVEQNGTADCAWEEALWGGQNQPRVFAQQAWGVNH